MISLGPNTKFDVIITVSHSVTFNRPVASRTNTGNSSAEIKLPVMCEFAFNVNQGVDH